MSGWDECWRNPTLEYVRQGFALFLIFRFFLCPWHFYNVILCDQKPNTTKLVLKKLLTHMMVCIFYLLFFLLQYNLHFTMYLTFLQL